jgi:hypothetical protein
VAVYFYINPSPANSQYIAFAIIGDAPSEGMALQVADSLGVPCVTSRMFDRWLLMVPFWYYWGDYDMAGDTDVLTWDSVLPYSDECFHLAAEYYSVAPVGVPIDFQNTRAGMDSEDYQEYIDG